MVKWDDHHDHPSVAAGGNDDHRQQTHDDEDRAEGILEREQTIVDNGWFWSWFQAVCRLILGFKGAWDCLKMF